MTLLAPTDVAFVAEGLGPRELAWLAIDDLGAVVGALRLALQSGATGLDAIGENVVIDTVAVSADHRRRGYGTLLMQFVEGWLARRDDIPHVISLGVETDNEPAIALYEHLGYQQATTSDGTVITFPSSMPYGSCVVMFKRLTGSA